VNDVRSGDAPDGAALYSGDAQAAGKFINICWRAAAEPVIAV
jgi:hypothetical protein